MGSLCCSHIHLVCSLGQLPVRPGGVCCIAMTGPEMPSPHPPDLLEVSVEENQSFSFCKLNIYLTKSISSMLYAIKIKYRNSQITDVCKPSLVHTDLVNTTSDAI